MLPFRLCHCWRNWTELFGISYLVETVMEDLGSFLVQHLILNRVKFCILCNLCGCVGVYYHICNCLVILNAAFACVGTLAIISKLDCIDRDFLGSWLAWRQPRFGDVTEIGERSDVSIIFLHILKEFIYYMVIIYIYTYVFLD